MNELKVGQIRTPISGGYWTPEVIGFRFKILQLTADTVVIKWLSKPKGWEHLEKEHHSYKIMNDTKLAESSIVAQILSHYER